MATWNDVFAAVAVDEVPAGAGDASLSIFSCWIVVPLLGLVVDESFAISSTKYCFRPLLLTRECSLEQ